MKIGFEYTRQDLEPVRPLYITLQITQVTGSVIGLYLDVYPDWYENICICGAIATFPGYIIGLGVQYGVKAERISENKVMVRRMGLISLLLSVAALVLPKL